MQDQHPGENVLDSENYTVSPSANLRRVTIYALAVRFRYLMELCYFFDVCFGGPALQRVPPDCLTLTWRRCELPYTRILNFGGNGPPAMSDRVLLLHKPWVTANGSHLGYVTFPWDGQKYLPVKHNVGG